MTLDQKRTVVAGLSFLFLGALLGVAWVEGGKRRFQPEPEPVVTGDSARCLTCHQEKTPVIARQWRDSKHARLGVGCYECHRADESDKDGFLHEGRRIATIATPKDCEQCHKEIGAEFDHSHQSRAAEFIGSLDNVLGEVVEGRLAAVQRLLAVPRQHGPLRDRSGVTINRQDCPFMLSLPEARRSRLLSAQWGGGSATYNADIEVIAYDRPGLLRDTTDLFAREKINVVKVESLLADNQAKMRFLVEIKDLEQLSRLLVLIQHVPNVVSARRRTD